MKIEAGKIVVLRYELYSKDGELFESSEDEPIEFVQGEGDVLPGLESALEGRDEGAKLEIRLRAAEAFGEYNPEGLVSVPRSELPPDVELEPDEWITVVVQDDEAGEDEEPGEMDMRIAEVGDDAVVLDANHPLAGQDVTFKVEVLSVSDPT
jgi:FKBP-type peptidyl-prolyl cis-trans isomerase 2